MKVPLFVAVALWALPVVAQPVSPLQKFEGCRFVPTEWADGDSFMVELKPGRREVVRLYFADCPETSASDETDQRRLREQSAHFGVVDPKVTLDYGRRAAAETAKLLEKPFTVHTTFARALGRSAKPRIYAFVTLADGRDLGAVLVGKGLARSYGVGRTTPDGQNDDEAKARMGDLELEAALRKAGLWAETDAEHLADIREARRKEARRIEEEFGLRSNAPVNANTASMEEIDSLPGIGPKLARRIIEGRPYSSVDDLRKIPGLGGKTWEQLVERVVVTP
jgi:DNA uptake protein ComE-like DNA-binding protein